MSNTAEDVAAAEPEPQSQLQSAALYDPKRLAELIKTHYDGLLRLFRSRLRDAELAAELVNEAILVTLEHARQGRLAHADNIAGYVSKVAMNLLFSSIPRSCSRSIARRSSSRR